MKLKKWMTAGLLGLGTCGASMAASPPPSLDRPTPPPCCADGICQPNPLTWGHYATRWRRWPTDYLEPLPDELQPPPPLAPDVPAFEPPTPEEEDRRAPPPTAPRGEPEDEDRAPAPPARAPGPGVPPTTPPAERPSTLPFGEPADESPPALPFDSAPPPTTLPFGGETPTTLPFGEPMGDVDPPPAPPFATPSQNRTQATRGALPLEPQPAPRRIRTAQPSDPPPAMPVALTSWTP